MKNRIALLALLTVPVACSASVQNSETTNLPAPPPAPPEEAAAATSEPTASPQKTQAETLQAEDAAKLAADREKMRSDAQAELARFTPELRAAARRLAGQHYTNLESAMTAALNGMHRQPGHAERDEFRHPLQTLQFFGLKPNMTVLEYGPGAGWYTELLAPTLAAKGTLYVTTTDPKGPLEERSTLYAQRLKHFLDKSPELYGKVEPITVDAGQPELGLEQRLDLVLVIRGMHGMVRDGRLEPWLNEFHEALKPGGILGVVQHRTKAGTDPVQSAKQGYVPEAWLIEQIEAGGFKLDANPRDTADHAEGVWTLPPTLRLKDQDREKYLAIGESDRMTLRFVKVEKKE